MNNSDRGLDEKQFVVKIRVSNKGLVTTAVADLSQGEFTLTARGEGRAHPATEMRQMREDIAVVRALTELGRQLHADAADEYATAVSSIDEPMVSCRSVA